MKIKLLFLLFFAFFSTYAQTNLVSNGNFENWSSSSQPDNWFRYFNGFASQSASAQNGASSTKMKIVDGTFNYINSEYFPVVANKTYRITMYHKLVSGSFSSLDFSVYHKPGTFKEEITKKTDATFSSSEWRKIEFDYTSTVSENIEIDIWTNGALNSEILVDNVSVFDVATIVAQYTLIPDVNFETKLISLGYDSGAIDGKVLTNNINKLKSLNVSNSSIADLTGIQEFVSLTSLVCYSNQLQVLDLSNNPALTTISCYNNALTSINLSKQVNLKSLYIRSNNLTNLDLINCPELTNLDCSSNNSLTTLNLSSNKYLKELELGACSLTSLDLSQNNELTLVDCFSNDLTSLILPMSSTLKKLICDQNELVSIDVSKYPNLVSLVCSFNKISNLNVTNNNALQLLYCHANKLKSLDLAQNKVLTTLFCHNNLLESINLKNGNNASMPTANVLFNVNSNLTCIQVDNKAYADANWSSKKDVITTFSEICSNLSTADIVFEKLSVYPNPTKGALFIENVSVSKVVVYDVLGRLMNVPFSIIGTSTTANLEQFPKGIYYMYLESEGEATVRNVIVE